MLDPEMSKILANFDNAGSKPAGEVNPANNSRDPAMHDILNRFDEVGGTVSALLSPGKQKIAESLGREQKRVGQLAAMYKPKKKRRTTKHGDRHPMQGKLVGEDSNPIDSITVDVPLMIRMLEYAREDAKDDMDLHDVAQRMIEMSTEGNTLTMSDYDQIVGTSEEQPMTSSEEEPVTEVKSGPFNSKAIGTTIIVKSGEHEGRVGKIIAAERSHTFSQLRPFVIEYKIEFSDGGPSAWIRREMVKKSAPVQKDKTVDEDYVGAKEAPTEVVSSVAKSYKDFLADYEKKREDKDLHKKGKGKSTIGNTLLGGK